MNKEWFIYGLKCPTTGDFRYIGKSNNPSRRFKEHTGKDAKRSIKTWVSSLKSLGLQPELVIIEKTTLDVVVKRELFWIKEFESKFDLFNLRGTKKEIIRGYREYENICSIRFGKSDMTLYYGILEYAKKRKLNFSSAALELLAKALELDSKEFSLVSRIEKLENRMESVTCLMRQQGVEL